MKKIFALVMVATILGGILAGCKGSEETTTPTATGTGTATGAPASGGTGETTK